MKDDRIIKVYEKAEIDERLKDVLCNRGGNYIYPFFWIRPGEMGLISDELNRVYECGIRAVCVEARPYEGFGEDSWWKDVELILKECTRLGMKVWILDDERFPTGFAANYIQKNHIEPKKIVVISYSMDALGPIKDGAVLINHYLCDKYDEIIGVYACKREKNSEVMTGEIIDLTENISGDFVYFDLPDGCYRISVIVKTLRGYSEREQNRIDMLSKESAEYMIKAVYEPHFEHFKEYFGNTLEGFFSDEPCFDNRDENREFVLGLGRPNTYYPWNDCLIEMLKAELGEDARKYLPFLWQSATNHIEAKIRTAYMNCITRLYQKNFSMALGDWCREHGVLYTGHVVEDNNTHTKTSAGAGHYFRAMSGEDIPGVDVVLNQIIPGMADYPVLGEVCYRVCDNKFFHYTLAKLASSDAHIRPETKGRAMCEIFGAYGWAEGVKMMKWLTDFMLVRGINYFVPHAFSMRFPDADCPPHFYACGNNPQFKAFGVLMQYMNRMSHILTEARHIAQAAVLYQAEAEWSGAEFDYSESEGKVLYDNQIDYDIVPIDALKDAVSENGKLKVNRAEYDCFIVPHSTALPIGAIEKLYELSQNGVSVLYADALPEYSNEGVSIDEYIQENERLSVVKTENLAEYMQSHGFVDVLCVEKSEDNRFLRVFHCERNGNDVYMFNNENETREIETPIRFKNFGSGDYIIYDAMANSAKRGYSANGTVRIKLSPYSSVVIITGKVSKELPKSDVLKPEGETALDVVYELSLATEKEYPYFKKYGNLDSLKNITARDMLPQFSGHMRYETRFNISVNPNKKYILDLGYVGETAEVSLNGENIGIKIAPPYRFDISDVVKDGTNELCINVTNHLGFEVRDKFSRFLKFEPSGLIGPVKILCYMER
ncbi:MAG: glycosyl hydrolase [Eubacteriales bacterium]|nr:glycosyl hydrolase [Eubacteriales bacterium]